MPLRRSQPDQQHQSHFHLLIALAVPIAFLLAGVLVASLTKEMRGRTAAVRALVSRATRSPLRLDSSAYEVNVSALESPLREAFVPLSADERTRAFLDYSEAQSWSWPLQTYYTIAKVSSMAAVPGEILFV